MRAIVAAVLLLAACGAEKGDSSDREPAKKAKAPTPSLPLTQVEFLKALRAKLGASLTNGAEIGGRSYSTSVVVLKVVYPPGAKRIGPEVGELDARMVAGAAVKVLMENGWNPREKMTTIAVAARQVAPESPTGGEQVFKAGTATYEPAYDRVTFAADE